MFGEQWWQSKNESKELTIGWLYNNDIKDDFAKGYTKNLTDYWSVEMSLFLPEFFADDTITGLLKQAHDNGFEKIIVFKQGCFPFGGEFQDEFKKCYIDNPDAKFIGHILDREKRYYEIHPQTFLIDLNWWSSVGFPEWGDYIWDNEPYQEIEPVRSEENHHDQYTPYWIAPGKKLKTYVGKQQGWSMVKALLDDGQKITSWPKKVRLAKYNAYAEVEQDGPRHRAKLIDDITTNNICFVANTEVIKQKWIDSSVTDRANNTLPPWNKQFQQVVTPAAGLSTLIFAFKLGLKKNDKIVIYDVSQAAIDYTMKIIEEWNGNDYTKFAKNIMKNNKHIHWRGMSQLPDTEKVIEELNQQGFKQWITDELHRLEIVSKQINLFDDHKHHELTVELDDDRIIFLHLTNIHHYMPTCFYYSLKQRWQMYNDLLIRLKKKSRNNNILLYSARGDIDLSDSISWIDDAKIIEFEDISKEHILRKLKWNK